jgi:hypothetical protein
MLSVSGRVRVFVAVEAVDFRRGIDSLLALVRDGFGDDAFSGDLYLFFNRARNRLKILTWDHNGFWLHLKRLERGTFERIAARNGSDARLEIDRVQFSLLLEGIELKSARIKKHFAREIRLSARHGEGNGELKIGERAADRWGSAARVDRRAESAP